MKSLQHLYYTCTRRGFILPLTLLVSSIILTVATGISVILTKELYFSRVSRDSHLAYYAADTALMCAIMVDSKYIDPNTGLGIFPYQPAPADPILEMEGVMNEVNMQRQARNLSTLTLDDISCATSLIFDITTPTFSVEEFSRINSLDEEENGKTSTFSMRMDLGDGTTRCALVIVSKTSKYRQIIARGFAACEGTGRSIERAIINTTEVQ